LNLADRYEHPTGNQIRSTAWVAAGLLFLSLGLFSLFGRNEWNPVVSLAERTAEDIAAASVGVYISLRAINAALSTAQEIEVGASVVGQASLQPLKALEPVDDTVERVANAVFLVLAGAALLAVGLAPVVSIGLVVLGAGLLAKTAIRRFPAFAPTAIPLCNRSIVFGLCFGFVIPFLFVLGVWVGELATTSHMNDAVTKLDEVAQKANILIGADTITTEKASETASEPPGVFNWLTNQIAETRDGVSGVFEKTRQ